MAKNNNGETVLHYAISNTNNLQLFQKLLTKLKNLNDLTSLNDKGATIIHTAVAENKSQFLKAIIEYIDKQLDIENDEETIWNFDDLIVLYYNKTGLNADGFVPKPNSVKMKLLNFKENITGRTALAIAVNGNHLINSLMLLAQFVNPNIPDMAGEMLTSSTREINDMISKKIREVSSLYEIYQWDNNVSNNSNDMIYDEIDNNNPSVSNKRQSDENLFNVAKMMRKN